MGVYLAPDGYNYVVRLQRLTKAMSAARRSGDRTRQRACGEAIERLWKANKDRLAEGRNDS